MQKEHPEISFVFSSFIPSSSTDSLVVGKATGIFTFLGVAKEIEVDMSFNYLKDAANKRAVKNNQETCVTYSYCDQILMFCLMNMDWFLPQDAS